MTEEEQYFVRRQGRVEGPWPASKLKSEVALKKLSRFHEVSINDKTSWVSARSLDWLFSRTKPALSHKQREEHEQEQEQDEVEWYLTIDGEQVGPLSESQVADELVQNRVNPDDLVWTEGFTDWTRLESIPEFQDAITQLDNEMTAATRMIDTKVDQSSNTRNRTISKMATASFVCGLLFCFPLNLAAIVLCFLALREIKNSSNNLGGHRLAWGGGIIGGLALVANIVILVLVGLGGIIGIFNS